MIVQIVAYHAHVRFKLKGEQVIVFKSKVKKKHLNLGEGAWSLNLVQGSLLNSADSRQFFYISYYFSFVFGFTFFSQTLLQPDLIYYLVLK